MEKTDCFNDLKLEVIEDNFRARFAGAHQTSTRATGAHQTSTRVAGAHQTSTRVAGEHQTSTRVAGAHQSTKMKVVKVISSPQDLNAPPLYNQNIEEEYSSEEIDYVSIFKNKTPMFNNKFDKEKAENNRKLHLKRIFFGDGITTNRILDEIVDAIEKGPENIDKVLNKNKCPLTIELNSLSFQNCLHYACNFCNVQSVDFILKSFKKNKDYLNITNLQSHNGKTALMLAIDKSSKDKQIYVKIIEILDLFIKNCAIDYELCDKQGKNILDYVKLHLPYYENEFCEKIGFKKSN